MMIANAMLSVVTMTSMMTLEPMKFHGKSNNSANSYNGSPMMFHSKRHQHGVECDHELTTPMMFASSSKNWKSPAPKVKPLVVERMGPPRRFSKGAKPLTQSEKGINK